MTNKPSYTSNRTRAKARHRDQAPLPERNRSKRVRASHAPSPSAARMNRAHHGRHKMPQTKTITESAQESMLLTRRKFIYGAIGIGAVAVIGGGAYAVSASRNDTSDEINALSIPESAVFTQNDYEALENYEDQVTLVNSFDLPYGTLIWVNDSTFAACLLPTESGSPLAQIGFLNLQTGYLETIREEPVGKSEEYDIYDVRATSNGTIWTEANIMQGTWRIYTAKRTNGAFEKPIMVDEGDSLYEMPTLAAIGSWGFWQKIPRDPTDLETLSMVSKIAFGSSTSECLLETKRRNATPLYADATSIIASPRLDTPTVYHELTRVDASTGQITDTLVLPRSVKPLEAGYGKTGFMFSFPDIYNLEGGVSNLGTYVPVSNPPGDDYDQSEWFSFARTPTAPPAWAGDLLVVKSTYSICGIDPTKQTYFAIDVENGADSTGEYLASSGTNDTFVTYTNIDHTPVGGERTYTCRIKVWQPAS